MTKYSLEEDVKSLFKEIKHLKKANDNYLLENTFFLKDGRVVCLKRSNGVSRFPYGKDGFTLWAYSSGYISINESTFYLVLPSEEGKEPYLAFYAGESRKNNEYTPISLLGRAQSPLENGVERYCVYSKECVYYLTITKKFKYAVRIFVTDEKKVSFSVYAYNHSKTEQKIYLSSYMNCLFKYTNSECFETKWFKKVTYEKDMFIYYSPEDIDRKTHIDNYGLIKREFIKGHSNKVLNTTSRSVYMGDRENQLVNSIPLRKGEFAKEKLKTYFTDMSTMGDICHFNVQSKETLIMHYTLDYAHDVETLNYLKNDKTNFDDIEHLISLYIHKNKLKDSSKNMLKISFDDWDNEKINSKVLNNFLKYVIYQTEYCGLGKNSGALFLGVRDVMQQIEAALIWNPKECRKKILEVLSFIDSSGNPPRQYSIPPKGANPKMDLRDFIDQGVWIISTVYNYLGFTGDYSILKEKVGYYDRIGGGQVQLSKRVDSVYDHLLQIMDYLIKHIDSNTGCLRAMYGDWNDALDGLGLTTDKNKEYGDGVSIMATLQLYKNLLEMIEISEKFKKDDSLISLYKNTRKIIEDGIAKFAIVKKDKEKRIVHGWGDKRAYYVGSFNDVDGQSRNSSTSNSFYVISGMNKLNLLSHDDIVKAFKNLDSKYGIKTFEPYFAPNTKGVGRIINLPKGTAENGATYIHGSLFGVWALLMINEEEFAFEQLNKLLPLTHDMLTTTPFVMPNSYSYNLEEDMDGESMSDWYTGSANTLLKTIIRGVFGITVSLDSVQIQLHKKYPAKKASIKIKIKNSYWEFNYKNEGNSKRVVLVNDKIQKQKDLIFDEKFLHENRYITVNVID